MNIREMPLIELKALAYDQIRLIEQTQNNLRIINAEIEQKEQIAVPSAPEGKNNV